MVVWTGAREPPPLLVQLCKKPSSGQRERRQKPATSTQSSGQRERRRKPATSTGSALQVDMQSVRSNGSLQHQRAAARVKCSTRPLPPPPTPSTPSANPSTNCCRVSQGVMRKRWTSYGGNVLTVYARKCCYYNRIWLCHDRRLCHD